MDRGQPERPADGSDDTVEAIEAVVAPAEDDVSDTPSEGGSSMEAPPLAFVPGGRPPAHWVAYIRARAPGLLGPDGGLAARTGRPPGDVVPHGRAAHAAPWSPTEGGPPPRPAGAPAAFGDAEAPRARAADEVDPWAADTRPSPRPGPAPAGGQPAEPARSAAQPGAGVPPLPGTPSTQHDDVTFRVEVPSGEGGAAPVAGSESLPDEPERPGEGRIRAPDPAASLGDDMTPAPGLAWSDHSAPERLDAQMPPFPRPEAPSYPPPAATWRAFTAEPDGRGDVDASWPSSESPSLPAAPSPAASWAAPTDPTDPTASGPESAAPPTAGPTWTTFPQLPHPSPADPTTRDAPREDGWRVRATAPDTWRVARLDLPPWPDLPEIMPEADEPDWRSIERSLQRSARLDREQRRR